MRILFVTGNRIGDCVLSTGILGWMVDNLPKARFTVVCGPAAAPLFEGVPRLERIIPLPKRDWGLHWWDLWKQVFPTFWSTLVDLRRSLLGQGVAARRRLALKTGFPGIHQLVQLSNVLKLKAIAPPRAFLTEAQRQAAFDLVPGEGPVLALGIGAAWQAKRWAPDRFAELAARLTAPEGILPGARVMVVGGADEVELAATALAGLAPDRRIDLTGRVDVAVAQACLQRASLFIGNDSGAMHMAAAAGTPTLGLFGPSRSDRYGPWGEHCRSLRTPESYETLVGRSGGPHPMNGLTVAMVEAAAKALWTELHEG